MFRLARVLRLRSQLRQQAQDEMARARAALDAVREQIAAARVSQDLAREAEAAAAAIGLTADELLRFRAFEDRERAREQQLELESKRLANEVVQRHEVLLTRRREERQLEVLRERASDRMEAEEERSAMLLLDDLARRRQEERR
jgi:flagellar export protein FliJ